jgi:filamentous hemagglutinin
MKRQIMGLPPGFPTVDRYENGVVTSNKSIDLNAPSYQNMRQLATTLENYIDKVADFNGAARGHVDIRRSDITGRQLQIAIPPGSMSPAQKAVFAAAATEAKIKGVTIIVTEIH